MARRFKQAEIGFVDKGLKGVFGRVRHAAGFVPDVEVGAIDSAPETVMIARVHELGLGTAPQRSFLRRTIEIGRHRYAAISKRVFGLYLDGRMSLAHAIQSVGIEMVSDVKARIMKGIPPPLKEETVARKKRLGMPRPSIALLATMRLFNSIKLRVRGGSR